jgi:hypothetical protein
VAQVARCSAHCPTRSWGCSGMSFVSPFVTSGMTHAHSLNAPPSSSHWTVLVLLLLQCERRRKTPQPHNVCVRVATTKSRPSGWLLLASPHMSMVHALAGRRLPNNRQRVAKDCRVSLRGVVVYACTRACRCVCVLPRVCSSCRVGTPWLTRRHVNHSHIGTRHSHADTISPLPPTPQTRTRGRIGVRHRPFDTAVDCSSGVHRLTLTVSFLSSPESSASSLPSHHHTHHSLTSAPKRVTRAHLHLLLFARPSLQPFCHTSAATESCHAHTQVATLPSFLPHTHVTSIRFRHLPAPAHSDTEMLIDTLASLLATLPQV